MTQSELLDVIYDKGNGYHVSGGKVENDQLVQTRKEISDLHPYPRAP